ncbi:MAG: hypothetical protein SGJ13_07365 [Actinomycetota bacterium]|nr:hypothetical protein [Actinomycetota bacterium]
MRRLLFVMLASVALLAGCGSDDDVETTGPPEPTTTLGPDTAVSSPPVDPGAPAEPGGAERVEPVGNAVNVNPVSFDPSEAEAVDGGVLIRFWGGVAPCFVLDRYEVEESEVVTVNLYAGSDPSDPDGVCIELAKQYEVLVPLQSPLANRVVADGSVS